MIDINVVASGNTAALLAFECERLDLNFKISEQPLSTANFYIIDVEFYNSALPPSDRTVIIGSKKNHAALYCLGKPFLLSDLRQILRKLPSLIAASERRTTSSPKRSAKSINLNEEEQSVSIRKNKIMLSPTEYTLMKALVSRKGEILTYEEINALIDGTGTNKANVYVCFLRKKLEAAGDKIIYSIRGKGFTIK